MRTFGQKNINLITINSYKRIKGLKLRNGKANIYYGPVRIHRELELP